MTGCGLCRTPVNNGVAVCAEGPAGVAFLGAGSRLVSHGLRIVLVPGGNNICAALVALVDADVAVFAHCFAVALNNGCREGGGGSVCKHDLACLGVNLGIHGIDALFGNDEPVGVLSQSVVRIPCAHGNRSDDLLAGCVYGSGGRNAEVDIALVKYFCGIGSGKAFCGFDAPGLPVVYVVDLECNVNVLHGLDVGRNDVDVIERANGRYGHVGIARNDLDGVEDVVRCHIEASCNVRGVAGVVGSLEGNGVCAVCEGAYGDCDFAVIVGSVGLHTVNKCFYRTRVQACRIRFCRVFGNANRKLDFGSGDIGVVVECHRVGSACKCVGGIGEYGSFTIGNNRRIVNCDVVDKESYMAGVGFELLVGVLPCTVVDIQLHHVAVELGILAVFVDAVGGTAVLESQASPRAVVAEVKVVIIPTVGAEACSEGEEFAHRTVDALPVGGRCLFAADGVTNVQTAHIDHVGDVHPHAQTGRAGDVNIILRSAALSYAVGIGGEAVRLDVVPVVAHQRIGVVLIIGELGEVHVISHGVVAAVDHTGFCGNGGAGGHDTGVVAVVAGPSGGVVSVRLIFKVKECFGALADCQRNGGGPVAADKHSRDGAGAGNGGIVGGMEHKAIDGTELCVGKRELIIGNVALHIKVEFAVFCDHGDVGVLAVRSRQCGNRELNAVGNNDVNGRFADNSAVIKHLNGCVARGGRRKGAVSGDGAVVGDELSVRRDLSRSACGADALCADHGRGSGRDVLILCGQCCVIEHIGGSRCGSDDKTGGDSALGAVGGTVCDGNAVFTLLRRYIGGGAAAVEVDRIYAACAISCMEPPMEYGD